MVHETAWERITIRQAVELVTRSRGLLPPKEVHSVLWIIAQIINIARRRDLRANRTDDHAGLPAYSPR